LWFLLLWSLQCCGGGGAWDGTNNVNATVTVNAIAPPTGDATQAFCNAGTVADLIAVGDNLKWYDAATSW
jgi:hypothetical protein